IAGFEAGVGNSTGYNNVFEGWGAGVTNQTGDDNTVLGYSANVGADNLTNATALGANATVAASNTIQLGNGSVTSVISHGSFNTTGGAYQIGGSTGLADPGTGNIF